MPGASLGTLQVSAVGRTAMSRVAFATSMPTKRGGGIIATSCPLARPCRIRALWALSTVRAAPEDGVTTHAHPRSHGSEEQRSVTPVLYTGCSLLSSTEPIVKDTRSRCGGTTTNLWRLN